jgi:ribosomal protein S18 acetylase RimI-like enzyme
MCTLPPGLKPTIVIRALQASDSRSLEWHGGEDRRSFYDEQARAHQSGEVQVFVAGAPFEGNPDFPIGQAAIHWNGKPTHPAIPDIQSVRVHPEFRGQGIATRLLKACELHAARLGHRRISLSVALDNPKAKRLYERCGYKVVGAPYCDVWFYADAAGQTVRVEETVLDMIKELD